MAIYLTVLVTAVKLVASGCYEALTTRAHPVVRCYKIMKLSVEFFVFYRTKYLIRDCGGKLTPTVPADPLI